MSAEAPRNYDDPSRNQLGLKSYIPRLQRADALVGQFPTWCFGLPAMLKGYFDRVYLPGVAFDNSDPASVNPLLGNRWNLNLRSGTLDSNLCRRPAP
jgi:NAD(P)H dehydrogenase (quinone)